MLPTAAFAASTALPRRRHRAVSANSPLRAPLRASSSPAPPRPVTIIVGGGPAGLLAAALLSSRGWRDVTVIERAAPGAADARRSFSYNVNFRGRAALAAVTGMLERVRGASVTASPAVITMMPPRGKAFTKTIGFGGVTENFWIGRKVLLAIMRAVVDGCEGVRVVDGEVAGVRFGEECEVFGTVDGEDVVWRGGLVVGCDGSRSVVREACKKDRGAQVKSANGFAVDSWESPATSLCYKTMELEEVPKFRVADQVELEDVQVEKLDGREVAVGQDTIAVLRGDAVKRVARDVFNMGMLPVGTGRRIGTIIRKADSKLWEMRTVEAGYNLFAENFPQLNDVHDLVSPEAMDNFVNVSESRFPSIQRCRSLGGKVEGGAAVVLLGDSLHAFPPDLGQGVNAALEDALIFCDALDAAEGAGEGLHGAVDRFAEARDGDISALMRLMVIGGPYQYQQDKVGTALWGLNTVARGKLAKLVPSLFSPQAFSHIGSEQSYSKVLEDVNATTRNLWIASAGLLGIVVMVSAQVGSL